ncbi:ubiquitin-related domain-containing protein [Aspergillus californicus]
MGSEEDTQSGELGPVNNTSASLSAAPTSQAISSSTLEGSDSAINISSAANAPQESNPSAAGNSDDAAPLSSQPSITGANPSTTALPETEEQKVATSAPELSSDPAPTEPEDPGPSLTIVLLLITGTRHPFKIDGNYLRKRGIIVDNDDPFSMSVYSLKESIWRSWQEDWESRPSSPSSIRLISFGKLLDDKSPLSDSKFSSDAPNVVHMTVKPQEIVDEEDAKGAKTQYSRDREASERSPRCHCIIQ